MAEIMPIAIVGMACRLPGDIRSPNDLWEFLVAGRNAQSEIPKSRFDVGSWYHPNGRRPGSVNARGGYFLDDSFKCIDPYFFGMSASEARSMDPQQRKLCETVFECMESAGITLEELSGSKTGCFVGNFTMDSAYDQWKDIEYPLPHQTTGTGLTILSNRINYLFNLKGPSFTIDTACSSTMYALHYACNSLRNGDCSAAIVGGTNLVLGIEQHIGSVALGALSPTSTCHTFDESADGYGRADAVGAFFLKRLDDAVADGDPIRAIIRNTAVNANGRSSGISHPSASQQEAVIRAAYRNAKIPLDETGYFEAHGTGTPVGDPIEVHAIGKVFGECHSSRDPLIIGSVKTNVGHGEAASAIASITKTVLALETGQIPATVGIKRLNPLLDLLDGSIEVCQSNKPWSATGRQYRRASINSFGYGGANAHAILDNTESFFDRLSVQVTRFDTKVIERSTPYAYVAETQGYLLPLSAHNEKVLQQVVDSAGMGEAFTEHMHDLAFTLSLRRSHFAYRAFLVTDPADSRPLFKAESTTYGSKTGKAPTLGFIFTGQGAQWSQMGITLVDRFPIVRSTLEMLDRTLARTILPPEWSIVGAIRQPQASSTINDTEKSQTLCTALQIALVSLLKSWGIHALGVVGHSSGEIAAAYAAGLCTAEQAIQIAYFRGIAATRKQQRGAMLAVGMTLEDAEEHLADRVEKDVVIACHNSPKSVTLSGTAEAIDDLALTLAAIGTFARKLKTSNNAYHSWLMSAAGREYIDLLTPTLSSACPDQMSRDDGPIMVSSVTNSTLRGPVPAGYWQRNLVSRVRFAEAVSTMLDQVPKVDHLLEIGPHTALAGPIREIVAGRSTPTIYLGSLTRGSNSVKDILGLAGTLYIKKYPLDLAAVNGFARIAQLSIGPEMHACKHLTSLPPYPWIYSDQDQLWYESRLTQELKLRHFPRHDLLGSKLPGSSPTQPAWRNILRLEDLPWLEDHRVAGEILFPAAGFVAIAVEAARQTLQPPQGQVAGIDSLSIRSALRLQQDVPTELLTDAWLAHDSELHISIKSFGGGAWTEHSSAVARCGSAVERQPLPSYADPVGGRWGINEDSYTKMWSEAMRAGGMDYGPCFAILSDITVRSKAMEAAASVSLNATEATVMGESRYPIHPTAVDAAFQLIVMAGYEGQPHAFIKTYIPTVVTNLEVALDVPSVSTARVRVSAQRKGLRTMVGHAKIVDDAGLLLLRMDVELTSLESPLTDSEDSAVLHPYNRVIWRPDFDHLTSTQLAALLPSQQDPCTVQLHFEKLQETCVLILLNDCRRVPTGIERNGLSFHMQRYVAWVETQGLLLSRSHSSSHLTEDARERRIRELAQEMGDSIPELALIVRLHNNLLDITFGRVGALEVMIEGGLLSKVYEEGFSGAGAYDKLAGTLRLLGHKDPRMRILEVGAGSGGATMPALKALSGDSTFPHYREYVFTDVSTAFLSRAREKFRDFKRLAFSLLDIETRTDNLEDHSFDLIIASNVIHATTSIVETLRNCRKLLRPNGRLILVETTQIRLVTGLLVGQLPGYWLGVDDGRPDGPFISSEEWNQRLISAGFSGADHVLYDHREPYNSTAAIVSSSQDESRGLVRTDSIMGSSSSEMVYLIYLESPHALLPYLETHYKTCGVATARIRLCDVDQITSIPARTVVLIELERAVLCDISQAVLHGLQQLIPRSTSSVWVTNAGTIRGQVPDKALVMGLVKSISIEEPSFRVATIDLDPDHLDTSLQKAAELIYRIEEVFHEHPDTDEDYNFVEQGGLLHISRNIIEEAENASFRRVYKTETELQPCPVDSVAVFGRTGDFTTMHWDRKRPFTLDDDQILVDALEFTIDKYVVAMLRGDKGCPQHPVEVFGCIRAVGRAVSAHRVGDKIVCLGPPWLEKTFAVHHKRCINLNESKPGPARPGSAHRRWLGTFWRQGKLQASQDSPNAECHFRGQYKLLCMAWHVLHGLGVDALGKDVLVDLPGDILGHAVSRLLLRAGAKSVTAIHVSGRDHAALRGLSGIKLCKEANLPRSAFDTIVTRREGDQLVHRCLLRARRGGQIVVLLDSDSTSSMSKADRAAMCPLVVSGLSVRCINFADLFNDHDGALHKCLGALQSWTVIEDIEALPSITFPLSDMKPAAQATEPGSNYAAVQLSALPGMSVQVRRRPEPVYFKSQAAYLLVGCLGGLGRVITMWMISRGARNFVFLSRSAADKPEAASLVAELHRLALGDAPDLRFTVVRGDVSCAADVEKAVKCCTVPIRGVIHAAMVLKESLFNEMSKDVWDRVVQPKVAGARNLHEHTLGMDLDFFAMTSTILSVVGAATQSNYAAANAYLDNLARHRHHRGLQATSLSIGMVVGVGYVEEHEASEIALRRNGMYGINMAEFLNNLELACRRKVFDQPIDQYDTCAASNIITGMDASRITRNNSKTIWQRDARLRHFLQALEESSIASTSYKSQADQGGGVPTAAVLEEARNKGGTALRDCLIDLVVDKIARFVMLTADQIDPTRALSAYGMDSMIGAELRAWLRREVGVDVPFMALLDQNLTFLGLADVVMESMRVT